MNRQEFGAWIEDLVEEGELDSRQAEDLLHQRQLFDENRVLLEVEFRRATRVVGFVAGSLVSAESVTELLDTSAELYDSRLIYFERVGEDSGVALFWPHDHH